MPVSGSNATTKSFGPKSLAMRSVAGNAAAAGAAGEQAFHLREAARDDETFFVIDLKDVVEDFQVHGGGEKILADAFDNVGLGLDRFSGFEKIVVERTNGIDADNFYGGIFFFQIISRRR